MKYLDRFNTKLEWQSALREIFTRTPDGVALAGADLDLVMDTLACHPSMQRKVQPGIAYITCETHCKVGVSRCFFLHRPDGKMEEFGFTKCLKTPWGSFTKTLRFLVQDDITAWKNEHAETGHCAECQIEMRLLDAVVDHYPYPFMGHVWLWLAGQGDDMMQIFLTATGTELEAAHSGWVQYHHRNAIRTNHLRLVCPTCNKRTASYVPPIIHEAI